MYVVHTSIVILGIFSDFKKLMSYLNDRICTFKATWKTSEQWHVSLFLHSADFSTLIKIAINWNIAAKSQHRQNGVSLWLFSGLLFLTMCYDGKRVCGI